MGYTGGADSRTRIFISYSRDDAAAFVDRLAVALDARGYDALVDRKDISPGEDWKARLEALVLQGDAVAFVLSPGAVASPYCAWEATRAGELGKRLAPILHKPLGNIAAPDALARIQYILCDSDDKFDTAVQQLCDACDVDINWVREHTRFVNLASRWRSAGSKDDTLLRGAELSGAEAWLAARTPRAPTEPEDLTEFLRMSRSAEVAALEKERATLRRTRRLQLGVGGLIALAFIILLLGGLALARLVSGVSQRASNTLAEIARQRADNEDFEGAARFALAGMAGSEWPLLGYNAGGAELELRRAVSAARGVRVIRGHRGPVWSATFSPDGRHLLTASDDLTARIWDAETGEQLALLQHDAGVRVANYSADGARIVTGTRDGALHVWDAATGRETARFNESSLYSFEAVFSPDGARLAVASARASVWDVARKQELFTLENPGLGGTREVRSIAYSPDGNQILTTGGDGMVRLWNASDGRFVREWRADELAVNSAQFLPSGTRVVTGSENGAIKLWAVDGRALVTFRGHARGAHRVAVRPDGRQIASVGGDGIAILRDGIGAEVFHGHVGQVFDVAFSPDGSRAVTAGDDGTTRIWATQRHQPAVLRMPGEGFSAVALSPDGSRYITASTTLTTINGYETLAAHMRAWDAAAQTELARVDLGPGHISSIAFDQNGQRFVTSNSNGLNIVWSLPDLREAARITVAGQYNGSGFFMPDGNTLLISNPSQPSRLFEIANGRELASFGGEPTSSSVSANGARLVLNESLRPNDDTAGVEAMRAHVWDTTARREIATLALGSRTVRISPDGTHIAAAVDTTIRVWSIAREEEVFRTAGHRDAIKHVAYSPSGRRIISASVDGEVRIWDAANGRELARFTATTAPAYELDIGMSADDAMLYVGADRGVLVWQLDPAMVDARPSLVARACSETLSDTRGIFSAADLLEAPMLDPVLDADACRAPSLWARLGTYLQR